MGPGYPDLCCSLARTSNRSISQGSLCRWDSASVVRCRVIAHTRVRSMMVQLTRGSPASTLAPRSTGPASTAMTSWTELPEKFGSGITLDLIASYKFNLPPPAPVEVPGFAKDGGKNVKMDGKEKNVLSVSTAEYNPCGWRAWLNGTTITLGMQNVFDEDPPFVAGAFENNYDESLADVRGRFWYVQLKKRF